MSRKKPPRSLALEPLETRDTPSAADIVGGHDWLLAGDDAGSTSALADPPPAADAAPLARVVKVQADFVTNIPDIMHRLGWTEGERLQRLWFGSSARQITARSPADLTPDDWKTVVPIGLDRILSREMTTDVRGATSARARDAYDSLRSPATFDNPNVRDEVARQVTDLFAQQPTRTTIRFGYFTATGQALHAQHVQHADVPGTKFRAAYLDDLTAALGDFSMYAVPGGFATRLPDGRIEVRIDSVGVYAADIFNFEGLQYLGGWKLPDKVVNTPESVVFGYTNVFNSTYRDYREGHCRGGDFVVMSDVKVTPFAHPLTFTVGTAADAPADPGPPAQGKGLIRVTVHRTPTGGRAATVTTGEAHVRLLDAGGRVIAEQDTDSKGQVTFHNVAAGLYRVVATDRTGTTYYAAENSRLKTDHAHWTPSLTLRPVIAPLPSPVPTGGRAYLLIDVTAGGRNHPLGDVPVTLTDSAGRRLGGYYSDAEGHVLFEGLRQGTYAVTATYHGVTRRVTVSLRDDTSHLTPGIDFTGI